MAYNQDEVDEMLFDNLHANASQLVAKTKAYYERWVEEWTRNRTNAFVHEKQFRRLLSHLKDGDSIVDIGCAHGIHVPMFLGIGHKFKYTGVDISQSMLEIAKERYPQLRFLAGDISDQDTVLPGPFSAFFAAAVLMHIPPIFLDLAFMNLGKLTIPGGYGYLTLPIVHPASEKQRNDDRYYHIMTEDEQREQILKHGWKIVESGCLDGFATKDIWRWYIVQLPKP